MNIGIDFDGVLAKHNGIPTLSEEINDLKPTEGAIDAVKYLFSLGHNVYVFTSNPNQSAIRKWLKKYNFPMIDVTNIKLAQTHVFIDDRAIRFTNWNDIRKYFG